MNRIPREAGGRSAPHPRMQQLRRGALRDGAEGLDLFSKTRRSHMIGLDHESEETTRLEGILAGSAKLGRSPMDDLLSSEIGKHDYDWLLTPPETPQFSSSEATEHQLPLASSRSSSNVRSVSVTKASRLSLSQTENGHPTRPARSSSVTRPSISTGHSYFSNNNRTSVLNTSTASVTSRPSTPSNRTTTLSTSRTSAPTSRSVPSRSSTPAKTRPSSSSNGDKTKSAISSRPSTPTGRSQISTNSNSISNTMPVRSISRPSTPTRRTPAPSSTAAPTSVTTRSSSVGRASTTTSRITGSASRPGSPAPRNRAPVQPIIPPDFPLDAPPNLRTKLPERAISAGRMRPGMALTVRANASTETSAPVTSNRRNPSPITARGRFPENGRLPESTSKIRAHNNGHDVAPRDIQKPAASEAAVRKSAKPASTTESTGFGRTISKKSLDMALKHMDIRQNIGGIRGASLFPQSIRSAALKGRPARLSDPAVPTTDNGVAANGSANAMISRGCNGSLSENGDSMTRSPDRESGVARASEPDIYGSYRYDVMLLKEDSKNTNWLHGIEDKFDQSPEFDHRFELLPEPFGTL